MNITELEFVDPATAAAQRWHARIARSGIVRMASFLAVLLGVLAFSSNKVDARMRHASLIREAESDRAQYPVPVKLIDLLERSAIELARDPFVPVSAIDRNALDALAQQDGIYLRGLQDEVRNAREVHSAAAGSRKDSFVACLLRPPFDESHEAIHYAATRYRWRVDLDAMATRVHDADVLHDGFRVASTSWLEEVRATHDPTMLRLLAYERAARTPAMLRRANELAATKYLAIVIDELPTGYSEHHGSALSDALRGTRLDAIAATAHPVRVALIDTTGKPLVRVRASLDARDLKVPNVLADAEEIHGCQAAMAVRAATK